MPAVSTKKKSNPFPPELLVGTEFDTAEDKSKFGLKLILFVKGGFKPAQFTKALYKGLSLHCFSHIAHFDQTGFFSTWFSTAAQQRGWVEYVLEHRICGDPRFTYSDIERLFKAWLAVHQEEVLEVIQLNDGAETNAAEHEAERLKALEGQDYQQFKVAAKISNVGNFGHTQFVMVARDGCAYKVHHIQSNGPWHVGQVFEVRLKNGLPTWHGMSVEVPERIKNCPPKVVEEVWG